jgi:effector-binding domain-containing protein
MEKQTAVEYLFKMLSHYYKGMEKSYNPLFEKAKQIEKEQITDAWEDGQDSFSTRNSEKYYNETFKK